MACKCARCKNTFICVFEPRYQPVTHSAFRFASTRFQSCMNPSVQILSMHATTVLRLKLSACGCSPYGSKTHHIVARRVGSCGRYCVYSGYVQCILQGQKSSGDIPLKPLNVFLEDRHLLRRRKQRYPGGARERKLRREKRSPRKPLGVR